MSGRRPWTALYAAVCTSPKVASLPDEARCFYLMALPQWDSWGCMPAEPHVLFARVWPLCGKTVKATETAVEACRAAGLVELHEKDGVRWLRMPDWEHKAGHHVRHDRRGTPDYPPGSTETLVRDQSGSTPSSTWTGPSERKKEKRERKKEVLAAEPPAEPSVHQTFVAWWCERFEAVKGKPYPFQQGKDGEHVKAVRSLAGESLGEMQAVAERLLADPFYERVGFDLGTLRSQYVKLRTAEPKPKAPLPVPSHAEYKPDREAIRARIEYEREQEAGGGAAARAAKPRVLGGERKSQGTA